MASELCFRSGVDLQKRYDAFDAAFSNVKQDAWTSEGSELHSTRQMASFLGLPLLDPPQCCEEVSAHFFKKKALFSSEMLHVFVNLRLQQ